MTSTVDEALLTRLYNRCDPGEPLEPDDDRAVLLDELTEGGVRVRGVDWVGRLTREISRSDKPICRFFSGLPGSGKSTELRRLKAQLDGRQFFPVLIDAEAYVDLSSRIDIPDILALMLFHTERAILEAEQKDPETAMTNGALRRFWDWVSRSDLELTKAEAGLQASWISGKIITEIKANPTVRQKVRSLVSAHLSRFIAEVQEEFRRLDQRVIKAGYENGLVLILDSLEKLRGTSTNWTEVLASAEHIFANGAPLLALPVHAIYTFPPALTRRLTGGIDFLPMIKVRDRARRPYAPGIEAARKLIRRRIPEPQLKALFGATEYEARERELITWSGGYPRELIRLLQNVVSEDESRYPLSERALQALLLRAGDEYAAVARATEIDLTVAARIALHQSLTLKDASELEAADRLMTRNVVFRYLNEEEWFDVHPAVLRLREVEQAMERIKASDASPAISHLPVA